jgi:HAD superfamily hydrolase (TIGR01450 family)
MRTNPGWRPASPVLTARPVPPGDACQTAPVLWLLDLDGVVWLSGRPIPGSPESIRRLRAAGEQVAFLTNNSGPTVAEHVAHLKTAGVDATPAEVLTSAHAAASLLEPGSTAAVLGGPGVLEALEERGVRVVSLGHPDADSEKGGPGADAVVVGRTTDLSYDRLAAVSTAIRSGARFVATNTDATLTTPDGPVPGAGAIVAFIRVASGRDPEVAGKPHSAAAAFVKARLGPVGIVVGDRLDTDGTFARAVGAPFALVLTGVTKPGDLPVTPEPDVVAPNLAAVVDRLLPRP